MEIVKQWSWATLAIYIFSAIQIAILFALAIRSKKAGKIIKIYKLNIQEKYIYYGVIYVFLIIFLTFRYIGNEVGGADTYNYMKFFRWFTYIEFDIKNIIILDGYEYLFYNIMCLVKFLGGDFLTFEFVIYSFIIIAYIFVMDKFVDDEKKCIVAALTFLPILKSINVVRNILAAFIGCVAIYYLGEKKYLKYILFSIVAFFNHYIALIILIYGVYDLLISKIIDNRKKTLIFCCTIFLLSFCAIPIIQTIMQNTGFGRQIKEIEISIWGYVPLIAFFVLLMLDNGLIKYLKKHNHFVLYKTYIFQIITLPMFISLNAASRILLFFELLRYILYADIYSFYRDKVSLKYVKIYDIVVAVMCILWFAFRIFRIWDGYCLMPYYNILFM